MPWSGRERTGCFHSALNNPIRQDIDGRCEPADRWLKTGWEGVICCSARGQPEVAFDGDGGRGVGVGRWRLDKGAKPDPARMVDAAGERPFAVQHKAAIGRDCGAGRGKAGATERIGAAAP